MGRSGVKIRGMTSKDIEKIKEVDRVLVEPKRVISWPLSPAAHWWTHLPALSFVAGVGGEVVGFLFGDIRIAVHGIDLGGWIDMVGVIPEYQRRGIGSMLVEAFCGECQKEGVRVRAIFREDDEQLIEFWTSVGFQRGKLICYRR